MKIALKKSKQSELSFLQYQVKGEIPFAWSCKKGKYKFLFFQSHRFSEKSPQKCNKYNFFFIISGRINNWPKSPHKSAIRYINVFCPFLSNSNCLTTHHTGEGHQAPGREDSRLTLQTVYRAECGLREVGRECYIGYNGVMLIYSTCVIVHISDIYYKKCMPLMRKDHDLWCVIFYIDIHKI